MSDQSDSNQRSTVHKINLKGPWIVEQFLGQEGSNVSSVDSCRVNIESAWASQFEGSNIKLTRSFNRPTGIEEATQDIFVILQTKNVSAKVHLNGAEIGSVTPDHPMLRIACLERLQPSNRLAVFIESVDQTATLAAWIEITG